MPVALLRPFVVAAAALLLAACGGGGTDPDDEEPAGTGRSRAILDAPTPLPAATDEAPAAPADRPR